jgi:hypothetical protein
MTARRFPPPWSVEEQDACFVVRDRNGQQLAYVYFENEPGEVIGGRDANQALNVKTAGATSEICH